MRWKSLILTAIFGTLTCLSQRASANLALSLNGDATISSLSDQLLDHSRSAAGRQKNVWDADPPLPAVNGEHYFIYNMNADGTAEADTFGAKSLTVTGIAAGPGYTITEALILLRGQGAGQANFYTNIGVSSSYDDPNVVNDFSNYIEIGVVRVTFTLTNPAAAGVINGSNDGTEEAYAGVGARGDEHFRIFTESRVTHDTDAPRAAMTSLVPTAFVPGTFFEPGYLDFGNGNVARGLNVAPAAINTVVNVPGFVDVPEPASLAAVGVGAVMALRRRRR